MTHAPRAGDHPPAPGDPTVPREYRLIRRRDRICLAIHTAPRAAIHDAAHRADADGWIDITEDADDGDAATLTSVGPTPRYAPRPYRP